MLNKCEFIGRITKDLELKKIKVKDQEELMSKVDFNIAHNFKKNGNDEVMFIPCTVWGKQADNMISFLHKGSKIYVEGYLNINNYTDERTNEKKTFTKINVKNVIFLDSKDDKTVNKDSDIEKQEMDFVKKTNEFSNERKQIEILNKELQKVKQDKLELQRELKEYERF
ncbi:single-stranded DNA-binding protein [Candidatus Phytoplasma sp. AldY-WA1]|uniref:single-stranded DNA-binding protein n=1 Tax=Candidatus Phytoplasma sp. AldY-WA1 TaxID=2852100 RepID=UPI00254EE6D5|nr:single-stranded DNA-binding protein [Candidatus Phytoplasma sp. AldY-WA1]